MNRSTLVRNPTLTFAAVCVGTIFLIEVFLKVTGIWVGRHSDTMFKIMEHDELLGWKMRPNIRQTVGLVDVENITVFSNSQGFWDQEFVLGKPSGKCRIAFLGDSFTWGFGVQEEERFTSLLKIQKSEWETLNFGIPVYGTDQAFLLWQDVVSKYRPDLVVLTVYKNDYVDNLSVVRFGREKPYFELNQNSELELRNVPVPKAGFWDNGIFFEIAPPYAALFETPIVRRSRIVQWLAKNSDLVRAVYTMIRTIRADPDDRPRKFGRNSRSDTLTETEKLGVAVLGGIVGKLAEAVEGQGGHLIVMFAGDELPGYFLQKETFQNAGVSTLDVTTPVLVGELGRETERIYQRYGGHWTPAAHELVAGLLANKISEEGFCSSPQLSNELSSGSLG